MASIKLGAVITGIAGKVGGTVFKRGKGVPTMSNKPQARFTSIRFWCINAPFVGRVCAATSYELVLERQQAHKKLWGYLPRYNPTFTGTHFRNLTDEERLSWNTGAINYPAVNKFGDTYTPSGFQVFNILNTNMIGMGLSALTSCPGPITLPNIPGINFLVTANGLVNLNMAEAIHENFVLQIKGSKCYSPGRKKPQMGYQNIVYLPNYPNNLIDISEWYADNFPLPLANQRVAFQYRIVSMVTGQQSAWQNQSVIVLASNGMSAVITITTTTESGTTTAHITTTTVGCASATLYKLTPFQAPTTYTSVATLTPNTTTVSDVVITEDTEFNITAIDSEGIIKEAFALALMP